MALEAVYRGPGTVREGGRSMSDVIGFYVIAFQSLALWASTMGLLFWPRETWSALTQALSALDRYLRG